VRAPGRVGGPHQVLRPGTELDNEKVESCARPRFAVSGGAVLLPSIQLPSLATRRGAATSVEGRDMYIGVSLLGLILIIVIFVILL
jgi:hypothetical protein